MKVEMKTQCACGSVQTSGTTEAFCDNCYSCTDYEIYKPVRTADDYVKDIKDQLENERPCPDLSEEPPSDIVDFSHTFEQDRNDYQLDYVVKEGKKYRRTWKVEDNGDRELIGWAEIGFDTTEADRISEGIRKIATSHPYRYEKATDTQIGGSHYRNMPIQPVKFITANDLGFCEGNVVKYICRYKEKGQVEDLQKAKHYIDLLIESME